MVGRTKKESMSGRKKMPKWLERKRGIRKWREESTKRDENDSEIVREREIMMRDLQGRTSQQQAATMISYKLANNCGPPPPFAVWSQQVLPSLHPCSECGTELCKSATNSARCATYAMRTTQTHLRSVHCRPCKVSLVKR